MKKYPETLLSIISLNYDDVLDQAYQKVYSEEPRYSLSIDELNEHPYLLKLHGGFSLKYPLNGKTVPIIPPGTHKNYLELPYSFIWSRALGTLIECDILRVIGCSLNTNDIGLIDLLFKASLARKEARKKELEIQLINSEGTGRNIRDRFGFFPNTRIITEIYEPPHKLPLVPRVIGRNAFKTWLARKIERAFSDKDDIVKTRYIKKVVDL
jgi:hypothetical protein